MGWIAGAGCFMIICFIVYKVLNERKTTTHQVADISKVETQRGISGKETTGQDLDKSASARSTPPAKVDNTIEASLPSTPSIQINMTTTEHDSQRNGTLKKQSMAPPPVPQITSSPDPNMPPPRSRSPPRLKPPTFSAPPPRPGGASLRPPPSAASSLRVPPTKVLPNTSMAPSSNSIDPSKQKSRQVALEPGHSPLDWAALTANPTSNLRGKDAPDHLTRITPSQLKMQHGRKGKDVWTVYQGKVYNITPYVPFHPGGKGEILRGAGKDSGKLFDEVHPWVNWDGMLKECLVGILVGEEEMKKGNELDEMD